MMYPYQPVDGGGAATPSPPAGRVGVGAMFKSHCKDTYQSRVQSSLIAPLLKVPPASRGEPRTGLVPPCSQGEPQGGGHQLLFL